MECSRKKSLWIWLHSNESNVAESDECLSKIPVLEMQDVNIINYSIGKSCGILLSDDEKCFQIGHHGKDELTLSSIESTLCEVSLLKTVVISEVSSGCHHSVALTEGGAVFCWGVSSHGQCGVVADSVSDPFLIGVNTSEGTVQFQSIACGKNHTMAVSMSGELWGWGMSDMVGGKSALTQSAPLHRPELVEHLCGRRVLQVSCGKYHTVVLTEKMQNKIPNQSDSTSICSICKQDTFKMFDNEDQVIISDTHICSSRHTLAEASPKKKLLTHNRSSSLPFFTKHSPLSARREHTSGTPLSLAPLMMPLSKSISSRSLEMRSNPERVELEMISKSKLKLFNSGNVMAASHDKNCTSSSNSLDQQNGTSVNGDIKHLQNTTEDVSSCSDFTAGSKSPSLASLDEYKSRMTLPLSSVGGLNFADTKSALAYLTHLTPETSSLDENQAPSDVEEVSKVTKTEMLSKIEEGNMTDTEKRTISERITQSITDNQLLSPLTSYSKNVFTGVMDRIEWIKTSTYEGVAPIRDFLSKEKPSNANVAENGESLNPGDPLHSTTPVSAQDVNEMGSIPLTLHTEVWAWGNNDRGQLGMSDSLDRFQPSCIKGLSGRGIVKLSCGSGHTLALSSNSEVYSWGCNQQGQLGRIDGSERNPVKIESKNRIWDVAAGKHHSLFLTDGISDEPSVMMCGTVSSNTEECHPLKGDKTFKAWKLRPVHFSNEMGFHCRVIAGFSNLSSCLSEKNPTDVMITLHALTKSERDFYHQVTLIKSEVLRPLKFSDLYKALESSNYGEILLQTLELFGRLSYNIGLNTVRLNNAVISGQDCDETTFSYMTCNLLRSFENYFKSLNGMIAFGFFEKCEAVSIKQSKFLKKANITQLFKRLLGEKRISNSMSENFLQLLQLPAFRLREYSSALNKLSNLMEENIPVSTFLEDLSSQWNTLWVGIDNQLQSANNTRSLWINEFKTTKLAKIADSLKKGERHIVIHSKKVQLDVANAGRFSSNWFLLFNDCLVLISNGAVFSYPLETLWCSPVTETDGRSYNITITTPEEELFVVAPDDDAKTKWITSINRAINSSIWKNEGNLSPSKESKQYHRPPPSVRHASYTFTKDLKLKGAVYDGAWLSGKPNGKGEMKWEDGKHYKGNFKNGKEDGYGEWKAASNDPSRLRYHGWWKDGKMDGHGKLWYSKYQVYEGSFKCNLREGHGVLRTGSVTEGSVYVGSWRNDQKNGFGVEDDITKGEKYIGMWTKNERHGVGILVTLDGLYGQGCFSRGNMSGETLLIEGRYVFEGNIAPGLTLAGKGRLTLPNGDKLEGSFTGVWSNNIRISGNLHRTEIVHSVPHTPESPKTPMDSGSGFSYPLYKDHARSILRRYNRQIMKKMGTLKGVKPFPLSLHPDVKWTDIFIKCRSSLKCPLEEGSSEELNAKKIWDALSVAMSTARRMREEFSQLSPRRKVDENKLNWLERIPSVVMENKTTLSADDVTGIKEYLMQAFNTPLHPLGELAESLSTVFRDSYSGAGAHKWLLTQAIADVRSFVRRAYDILRCLFPLLGKDDNASHMKIVHDEKDGENYEELSAKDNMVTAGDLVLPVLLPRVYPTLFTLYALRHEREDKSYWERVTRLNRHPDIALLSFLGVKSKFWLLDEKEIPPLESAPDDGQLYDTVDQAESSKWRHLLVAAAKDCSFLEAIETLQLISTTFIPAEKLNVIQSTFKHINEAVLKHHKQSHAWSMDDLFPVFQYVVIRARISHLGCEIQLIEDFLEPDLCKGEKGIMFTTLKACYFQIRVEKNM